MRTNPPADYGVCPGCDRRHLPSVDCEGKPLVAILPVTDEDKVAAWHLFYERPETPGRAGYEPNPRDPIDEQVLQHIQKVLENDRARVIMRAKAP